MRQNIVLRYIGMVLLLNAAFMFVSLIISVLNHFDTGFYPMLLSFLLTTTLGAFPLIFVERGDTLNTKESYVIVVGAWLLSCFAGAFPYILWGHEFTLANTWFESVSGYTTTGATILNDVEALPRSLLFWRSTTHWLGGVGVVMFALLILPSMGRAKLSSVELSSIAKDNYKYRTQKVIQILLFVYVGITIAETICLKIAGMTWFDAVNHAFSTVATGGFSTRNMSVAYYNSVGIEMIILFFMAISGLHFGLIFSTLAGKSNNIFRSEVSRYYIGGLILVSIALAISLLDSGIYPDFITALRYSSFQTASIATTSGFATADTNLWTPLAIILLTFMMIQCACAGSTCGGIKCDRMLLSFKMLRSKILQQQHPNAIIRIKLNNITQEPEVVNLAMIFIVVYLMFAFIGTVICTIAGVDLLTSFSLIISCMGNVGPGFGGVSSFNNYSALPDFVKYLSSLFMLLGRLEIFGFIQLFMISWWR